MPSGKRARLTRSAAADLREIRRWLVPRAGTERASAVIGTIRRTAQIYAERPGAGRAEPDVGPGVRAFVEAPYVLFYVEEPGGIAIVRVIHGARDRDAALRERPVDLND